MLYGLLSRGVSFTPAKDIPDLSGKVILVTGGNVGLGRETIFQLAQHNPAHIYLAARSAEKASSAIASLREDLTSPKGPLKEAPPITFIQCDLGSLPSVQKAARDFQAQQSRLDLLYLNAGVMALPPGTTEQGYEIQFGTNHVGHALFTKLLLPTLLKTAEMPGADVRVVAVASIGHLLGPLFSMPYAKLKSDMRGTWTGARYGLSKLSNILFIKELARRNPSITAVTVHPGVVRTELYNAAMEWPVIGPITRWAQKKLWSSVETGARNQLWAGTAERRRKDGRKGGVVSGEYYTPVGVAGQGSRASKKRDWAEGLWEWTEKELQAYD